MTLKEPQKYAVHTFCDLETLLGKVFTRARGLCSSIQFAILMIRNHWKEQGSTNDWIGEGEREGRRDISNNCSRELFKVCTMERNSRLHIK